MQLNGIAHVYLTVSNFDACLPFYEELLEFFVGADMTTQLGRSQFRAPYVHFR